MRGTFGQRSLGDLDPPWINFRIGVDTTCASRNHLVVQDVPSPTSVMITSNQNVEIDKTDNPKLTGDQS
jgi:hypothetical protein